MERYMILVTVTAESRDAAFAFVEQAIEDRIDKQPTQDATVRWDDRVFVSTQDGTKVTGF